jgi:FkbM family methyltransferase
MMLENALARCRHRGHPFQTIVDVGASNGSWSLRAKQIFPHVHCHLIEAQSLHEPALKALTTVRSDFTYTLAAAADTVGDISFAVGDPMGGLASHHGFTPDIATAVVPATTIDHEVASRNLRGPFLLKLDTHGFEVPIFEGASETLKQTELICVETYNFQFGAPALRFPDMIRYMEARGFRVIDVCDPMWRSGDAALWQWDFFFAPATRPEFARSTF